MSRTGHGAVIAIVLTLWSASTIAFAGGIPATIVEVIDGDTLHVQCEGKPVTIRLLGIDSPEMLQPYGAKAREFLAGMATGKAATIDLKPEPQEGVYFGVVTLGDGTVLSRELVAAGLAWYRQEELPVDRDLARLAAKAITNKTGLWADPVPLAPWDFRRETWRANQRDAKSRPKEVSSIRALLRVSKQPNEITFSLSFRSEIGEVVSPAVLLHDKRISSLGIQIADASGKLLSQGAFRYG